MNSYTFHITLYDLAFLGTIFIGLGFALLLGFTKRINRAANRFLGLALATIVLWMAWVLCIDIRLGTYFPRWSWLPLQFSLTLGPLIYFYVLKITRPEYKLRWKDLLHFSPLLLQQGILVLEIKESIRTGAATYDTLTFQQLSPVLHLAAFISVITYLYWSFKLIERFYQQLKFNNVSDRYRYELRWLHNLLIGFGLLWLLWVPFVAVSYFYYHNQLGIHAYYPLYLLLAIMMIWIAASAFLKQEVSMSPILPSFLKLSPPAELKQKGIWLKKIVKTNLYYQNPELCLSALAEKLELGPHELSRIINTVLKKSFNDFINEFRVADIVRKMQDPAYDHITLLGIAFESGFNSKTTYNRTFKQITGKSPAEYKNDLKKERPSYNMGRYPRFAAVISNHEATSKWSSGNLTRNYMFRNYFKIAVRQLRRQKMYAAIKIGGFAFSIAACLLIALYIHNELSYDRSYPNANRIFRVVMVYTDNGTVGKGPEWPAPLAKTLKKDFPQVEFAGRLMPNTLMGAGTAELRRADQVQNTYEEGITFADQSMLDILKLPMVYGDRAQALASPHTVVMSRRKADKYFPGQNPVGKLMYFNNDNSQAYTVGGVMENFPATSHLQYDFMVTLTGKEFWQGEQNNWGNFNYPTYVLLKQGIDAKAFEQKITAEIVKKYFLPNIIKGGAKNPAQEAAKIHITLQPVTDINLYSYDIRDGLQHGDIRFTWLFGGVAAFILIIACINFVNLATAKSANRAKEVGLRKVVGSNRNGLIKQFLTESLLYSFLSFIIGLLLAWLLLPYFNSLASKSLTMPWGEWWLLPVVLVSAAVVGIVAGLYPAFYLSGFKPVQVLKGTLSTGSKGSLLRNSLVVFQFTASIMLIIGTMVIYNQMHYILNQKVGFDKDQVVIVQGANTLGYKNVRSFKTELQKLASVKSASISDYLPIEAGSKRNGDGFTIAGREKLDAHVQGQLWQIDDTYLKTLGMKLVEGRNFSYDMSDDTARKNVIINQTMAKRLNLKHPIGARISDGNAGTVIGVVADFNFDSMHREIDPLVLYFGLSPSLVSIKVKGGDMKNALQSIAATWKQFAPNQPIRYTFMDESFANMYADVQRMGHIFTTFAILAIIIACLGLFALSAFMAEQRSKEIGIRKVLGASVRGITRLLSIDFLKLVALAILIASPIAWWAMNKWLQGFVYHTPVQWWIFAAAGLAAILIALITVSFQSIKAALMNPVKSLKAE
ncbi:ABC transporter permease [Mucilaginibacter sp. OK098]|uniref:ABC transporter permease n=1 Tax=Mucilaginibacter sp. OK098 TaxID=1855297 RepID=UPI000914DF68|nr:ABC transporter permease [Mucilaginibacter sp. OK098]SHN01822.1 duplicated orphan permease [Mucilaginibacter sp. OK098]